MLEVLIGIVSGIIGRSWHGWRDRFNFIAFTFSKC